MLTDADKEDEKIEPKKVEEVKKEIYLMRT